MQALLQATESLVGPGNEAIVFSVAVWRRDELTYLVHDQSKISCASSKPHWQLEIELKEATIADLQENTEQESAGIAPETW